LPLAWAVPRAADSALASCGEDGAPESVAPITVRRKNYSAAGPEGLDGEIEREPRRRHPHNDDAIIRHPKCTLKFQCSR
jgi:hypothetical protein